MNYEQLCAAFPNAEGALIREYMDECDEQDKSYSELDCETWLMLNA